MGREERVPRLQRALGGCLWWSHASVTGAGALGSAGLRGCAMAGGLMLALRWRVCPRPAAGCAVGLCAVLANGGGMEDGWWLTMDDGASASCRERGSLVDRRVDRGGSSPQPTHSSPCGHRHTGSDLIG
jgi:hypothetical protein